jgi:DNA polymerase III delta subunit
MLLFLHGEDNFLVTRRKQALVSAFQKKYAGAECFVFDFEDQGTGQAVRQALDACEGGLFATEKMMVFLHPFVLEGNGEKLMTEFLKEHVATLPEHTILLLVHIGKIKKTHPLTKLVLAKMDKEEVYDAVEGKALRNMLMKELSLSHEGVTISPQALELFLVLTGDDTARQMSELEKLATYKGEGVITIEDVEAHLVAPAENNIFTALDALGRGDRKQALFLFRKETEKGDGVYSVLSMCAWQVRRLLTIREAYDKGIRRSGDIASATNLPPFTVQKAMATIEHFPLTRIKNGLVMLGDIDTAFKQGKADPEASLDIFVWKF